MVRKMFITLAALCWAAGFVQAGTIDPKTPDEKHVTYGKDFHCVGRLCGLDKDGKLGVGSCVAISARTVLTAAHVVHEVVTGHIHINDRQIDILKIEKPTEFVYGQKLGGDIAICFVKSDIGLDFYPTLYEKNDEISRIASISGFGLHGTFATGGVKSDKQRRAGSNVIDKISGDLLLVSPSSVRKTELEFCITPGDSGGGLFIDNKLAGINCCVFHEDGSKELGRYGHEAAHTRISKHRQWILDTVKLYESGFHGNEFIVVKEEDNKDINPVCVTTTLE